MAAGQSTRFGARCKLMAPLNGDTVLGHVLSRIHQANVNNHCPIHVVTHAQNKHVQALAQSRGASVVVMPAPSAGLGCSLAYGVKATGHWQGWIICLGDMPWIPATVYAEVLRRAYDACKANILNAGRICKPVQIAPLMDGRRGHPVFFSQYYYKPLIQLNTDKGASNMISCNIQLFPINDEQALKDVDCPEDIPSV